jgi:4-oxalocrotonate tautomerase
MPVTRIASRDGKTPEYKHALMDEIYEAMRETVAIKEGDRFMAITSTARMSSRSAVSRDRPRRRSRSDPGFLGAGKSADAKLAMYKRIVERLQANPGVRP